MTSSAEDFPEPKPISHCHCPATTTSLCSYPRWFRYLFLYLVFTELTLILPLRLHYCFLLTYLPLDCKPNFSPSLNSVIMHIVYTQKIFAKRVPLFFTLREEIEYNDGNFQRYIIKYDNNCDCSIICLTHMSEWNNPLHSFPVRAIPLAFFCQFRQYYSSI